MRLRQIALAARELEPVARDLRGMLGLEPGYRDPGVATFGLQNEVLALGDTFLEVVAPVRPDTAAGRFIERRGGDCGYMVIVQTDTLEADRRRIAGLGVRVVWQIDLPDVSGTHLHPRDVGGAILSIDESRPPESWRWAGPDWRERTRSDVAASLSAVEVAAVDAARTAERWAEVLGRRAAARGDGDIEIGLDRGAVRFVPAADRRAEGISAVEVVAADAARLARAARERGLVDATGRIHVGGVRIDVAGENPAAAGARSVGSAR